MDDTGKYITLKPLRKRLEAVSQKTSLRLDILQQDYLLSWILFGVFTHPLLKDNLVFKGGTCLKKCYFGDYRFSQDLDFTAKSLLPQGQALFSLLADSIKNIEVLIKNYAPMEIFIQKYKEKSPHPFGQEAFTIYGKFPWQTSTPTRVMIEISREEILLFPPQSKALIHDYGEPLEVNIISYSLEEIILEKLRAILQHTKKIHERDWNRSRARDYYDLWKIFGSFEMQLSLNNMSKFLEKKCEKKDVSFIDINAFFDEKMINNVTDTWEEWLGPLVRDLPLAKTVLKEVKVKIQQKILQSNNS
jgi:predicted nucleotidyltransferase component of viral defense system